MHSIKTVSDRACAWPACSPPRAQALRHLRGQKVVRRLAHKNAIALHCDGVSINTAMARDLAQPALNPSSALTWIKTFSRVGANNPCHGFFPFCDFPQMVAKDKGIF